MVQEASLFVHEGSNIINYLIIEWGCLLKITDCYRRFYRLRRGHYQRSFCKYHP